MSNAVQATMLIVTEIMAKYKKKTGALRQKLTELATCHIEINHIDISAELANRREREALFKS